MFDGFALSTIDLGPVQLRVRHGGSGPGVLLLHGHPQTHVMWHRVARALAGHFTLVMPDLRGYGQSSKPPSGADHGAYSKRAMAADGISLMRAFGFEEFAVVGHDRGARVGYRMALDHSHALTKLAVLSIIPTGDTWRQMDRAVALRYWHWLFLAQPEPLPERMISSDPEAFYFRGDRSVFEPAALDDYWSAIKEASTVHAMCEDYRAGAGVDLALDEADRAAGRRISCPVLVLWGLRDDVDALDPLRAWGAWAEDLRGNGINAGHFLAEEAPDLVSAELLSFLSSRRP